MDEEWELNQIRKGVSVQDSKDLFEEETSVYILQNVPKEELEGTSISLFSCSNRISSWIPKFSYVICVYQEPAESAERLERATRGAKP